MTPTNKPLKPISIIVTAHKVMYLNKDFSYAEYATIEGCPVIRCGTREGCDYTIPLNNVIMVQHGSAETDGD